MSARPGFASLRKPRWIAFILMAAFATGYAIGWSKPDAKPAVLEVDELHAQIEAMKNHPSLRAHAPAQAR